MPESLLKSESNEVAIYNIDHPWDKSSRTY